MRTFGVEEELLIVDPETGMLLPLADAMLPGLAPLNQAPAGRTPRSRLSLRKQTSATSSSWNRLNPGRGRAWITPSYSGS